MELDPTLHPIPMSPPTTDRLTVRWDEIVKLAELHRPDLIELRLILEADREAVYQASNQAKPKLDAVATYRWNGLEGTMPNRAELDRFGGSLNEWAFGINFSVPIGMRQSRAALRQQELITMRDQANLDQGIHNASHSLAIHVRNLAQYYDQYQAYHEARIAARANLDLQLANYQVGRTILLNVLTAITAWGDSVSAESQTLTLYNTELATLEVETGTILETHGIRFLEERFGSVGPLGRIGHKRDYPSATVPGPNAEKYPVKDKPAENTFELEDPLKPKAVSPQNK